jgi:hypothetical protein
MCSDFPVAPKGADGAPEEASGPIEPTDDMIDRGYFVYCQLWTEAASGELAGREFVREILREAARQESALARA